MPLTREDFFGRWEPQAKPGLFERLLYDEERDALVVHTVQRVDPILDHNKAAQNEPHRGYTPSRELRYVAEIPDIVIHQWMKQGINFFDRNDWPKIKKLLNDPEYLYLRTSPGKV